MSYKTPLIVKEIYLPISESDLNSPGISLDEYKEKY